MFRLTLIFFCSLALCACTSAPQDESTGTGGHSTGHVFEYPRDLEKDISSIIEVTGAGEQSFVLGGPKPAVEAGANTPRQSNYNYDVVIVGGGLAGLTSAVFLSEHGKSVLILEKEPTTGGLAAYGRTDHGSLYSKGAAYWTDANAEQNAIMDHIKMGDYKTKNVITEPVDAYLIKKSLILGIWDPATLSKLPAAFAVFKFELERSDKDGVIPNQPFEACSRANGECVLDTLNGREWINKMPQSLRARIIDWKKTPKLEAEDVTNLNTAVNILARMEKEKNGMDSVAEFLDQYSRSALGGTIDQISAMGLANFYISEIVPRYTSSYGTGAIAERLARILTDKDQVRVQTSSTVKHIRKIPGDFLQTEFDFGGQRQTVQSPFVVFASQLNQAPYIIEGFAEKARAQVEAIKSLQFANYTIHVVETIGHPYRQAFDTWFAPEKNNPLDFTDVVLGRWTDPKIHAYAGIRNFEQEPVDSNGILTLYDPLTAGTIEKEYVSEQVKLSAQRSLKQLYLKLADLPKDQFRGPFKFNRVESNRWPYSIHITKPGHYTKLAPLLQKHFGPIYFASNNIGAPSVEEAIFRGHCAANDILTASDAAFVPEAWSNCGK